jgi:acyl-CoA thioester hydrolase
MTHHPRVLVHTSTQTIRWGDMDVFGHVNNTVYFRYMEQARIEWLYAQAKAIGHTGNDGPVIVNASCNFLVPLVYPGQFEVLMYLGAAGRSSVDSFYEILVAGKKFADGAAKMVWIDRTSGRSIPLPELIAAPLRAPSG